MDFKDLLRRTNLHSLESFLLNGTENLEQPCDTPYAERLTEAERTAKAFFDARFADSDDYDEIAGYVTELIEVFQAVYFEIGLLLGGRIAYQIAERLAEFSARR